MEWDMKEALCYYKNQGAPSDQSATVNLLKEVQTENGGGIPRWALTEIAEFFGVRESYLQAVIKRIPSLRLADTHCLEMCGGPNCSKRAALAKFVEDTYGAKPEGFAVRYTGCMRMCGKGPNIRWDGELYNHADEALIRGLVEKRTK